MDEVRGTCRFQLQIDLTGLLKSCSIPLATYKLKLFLFLYRQDTSRFWIGYSMQLSACKILTDTCTHVVYTHIYVRTYRTLCLDSLLLGMGTYYYYAVAC